MQFRAIFAGEMNVAGEEWGTGLFIDGQPRFVGGTNPDGKVSAGFEEVRSSRLPSETASTPVPEWANWEVSWLWNNQNPPGLVQRMVSDAGFTRYVDAGTMANDPGVEWADRNTPETALAPNAEARYEVVVRVRQPRSLRLTRTNGLPDQGEPYKVVASLRDLREQPMAGKRIAWTITGKHPQSGSGVTNALGQVVIEWTGTQLGEDTVLAWHDVDNGQEAAPETDDPQEVAKAMWRTPNEVDPPGWQPKNDPHGRPLKFAVHVNPERPDEREYTFLRRDLALFPICQGDGRFVNMDLTVNVKPAAGHIKNAQVQLLVIDRVTRNENSPIQTFNQTGPPTADGDHTFHIDCLKSGLLQLRYILVDEQSANEQQIDWPIGGITLIDPQGVVHDGAMYDCLRGIGRNEEEARAGAAITGATVRLQRLVSGSFLTLLAGDPGIAPNVNPQVTGADGLFQWDVSDGFYRVLVTAPGYPDVTSRTVEVPPPVLDLHVAMRKPGAPAPSCNGSTDGTSNTTSTAGGGGGAAGGGTTSTPGPGTTLLSPPAIAAAPRPAVRVARLAARRSARVRKGKVDVGKVTCTATGGCPFVRVSLSAASGRKTTLIGSVTFRLAAGKARNAVVKLNARGRRLARRPMQAIVGLQDSRTGAPVTSRLTIRR